MNYIINANSCYGMICFQTYADEHLLVYLIEQFNKIDKVDPKIQIPFEGIIKNYVGEHCDSKGKGKDFFFIIIQMKPKQLIEFSRIIDIIWRLKYHIILIVYSKNIQNIHYGYDLFKEDPTEENFRRIIKCSLDTDITLLRNTNDYNSYMHTFMSILNDRMKKRNYDIINAWHQKDCKVLTLGISYETITEKTR